MKLDQINNPASRFDVKLVILSIYLHQFSLEK